MYLKQYEIHIQTLAKSQKMNKILSIMVHYFYEKYDVIRTPFKENQIQVLDHLFIYSTLENQIHLNFPDLIRIRY